NVNTFPSGLTTWFDNAFVTDIHELLFKVEHPQCRCQQYFVGDFNVSAHIDPKCARKNLLALLCNDNTGVVGVKADAAFQKQAYASGCVVVKIQLRAYHSSAYALPFIVCRQSIDIIECEMIKTQ